MGVRDLFKDGARAVSSRLSLTGQVMSASQKRPGSGPVVPSGVPEDMQRAMDEQNMATGAFSPGDPLPPYQPIGTPPVVTPFQVGQNIWAVPRGMTGVGFDTMKSILRAWDLAQLCIEVRQDEIRSLDWDIVVEDEDDAERYESELDAARHFFQHPGDYGTFDVLQAKATADWLRYDAAAIYPHRTRNGKLGALEAIDGTVLTPLIDGRGARPKWPAPAFVQWAFGLPWAWLTERDLIYLPQNPRTETLYGLAPIEWILTPANNDLRLQYYFLSYFTRGEVPEAFVNAPSEATTPAQVKALQSAYSATMSGAASAHHTVKWIPPGSHVTLANKGKFDVDFANWLLMRCTAAYKVQPAEVGYTEKVNKSSGDSQENVQYRRAIKPSTRYWEQVWNHVLHQYMGMPYARFKYLGAEEEEDQLVLAQTRQIYVQSGILSADEVRQELGYEVDPDAPVGRAFVTPRGIIFVDPASQAAARAQGAMQPAIPPNMADPDGTQEVDDDPNWLAPGQATVDPVVEPAPTNQGQSTGAAQGSTGQAPATQKHVQDELRRWKTAAVKRAQGGRRQKPFYSDAIPEEVHRAIDARLAKAATVEEVRGAFPTSGGRLEKAVAAPSSTTTTEAESAALAAAIRRAHEVRLQREFERLFNAKAPEVASALAPQAAAVRQALGTLAPSVTADSSAVDQVLAAFDWAAWGKELQAAITDSLQLTYASAAQEGLSVVGVTGNLNAEAIAYGEQRGAELVGMHRLPDGSFVPSADPSIAITDSTRNMLRTTIRDAITQEQNTNEIIRAIKDNHAFSRTRAETIARTELGFAYNRGHVAAYKSQGIAQVLVFDGEEFDEACREADGSIWTVEEADANPLQHPRCVRGFSPWSG